ncbi:GntR family transcriptional regulator [Nocardia harenae]|uniref:GntR family transcriptional regulator n=1 Tax=Nocardia harenae TaxID=358707 RepID=UPI0008302576|nr:GntR family transcriptional regulator [Nocardia harenae]
MRPPGTLHERVATQVRLRIRDGVYPVGAALPSESEMCAEFGVSRGPVRQAMAALRAEGLVTITQGRPATVRGRTPARGIATFTPFTRWVESTGRVAGNRTVEVARRRSPGAESVVEVVRVRLLDGVPAMLERSTFTEPVGTLVLGFDTDSGSITDFLIGAGVRFATIEHQLDAVAADPADAGHLGIEPGAPLLRERRVSRDEHGVAFEYADDRYRPDLVTFTLTSSG